MSSRNQTFSTMQQFFSALMAVPDSLSYTPRSGQQQSDDGAFPSDGAKSKSNRLLVIDNLDFFFERRFASIRRCRSRWRQMCFYWPLKCRLSHHWCTPAVSGRIHLTSRPHLANKHLTHVPIIRSLIRCQPICATVVQYRYL